MKSTEKGMKPMHGHSVAYTRLSVRTRHQRTHSVGLHVGHGHSRRVQRQGARLWVLGLVRRIPPVGMGLGSGKKVLELEAMAAVHSECTKHTEYQCKYKSLSCDVLMSFEFLYYCYVACGAWHQSSPPAGTQRLVLCPELRSPSSAASALLL